MQGGAGSPFPERGASAPAGVPRPAGRLPGSAPAPGPADLRAPVGLVTSLQCEVPAVSPTPGTGMTQCR